jgi:ribose-phosphate pyrophosphokinase
MKILDLTQPNKSEIPFERFVFPDGQDHIKILSEEMLNELVLIKTRITNASDLFVLLQATEVLRNSLGVRRIGLLITYLMSARMDRRMSKKEPISLKIVADIINSQRYEDVSIFDPHSSVTETLIDGADVLTNAKFIQNVLKDLNDDNLKILSPDDGAAKKITQLNLDLGIGTQNIIYARKSRSVVDGKISKVVVDTDDLDGEPVLIIDDICDGGATFIGLAKALREKNAGKLYLAVSHGIFSKGLDVLSDYEKIYTTNSYKDWQSTDKLKVLKF